jgi:hypothetical protein
MNADTAKAKSMSLLFRLKGAISFLVTGLVFFVGPIALMSFRTIAEEESIILPAWVRPFVAAPWLIVLVALPSLVASVVLMITLRHRWWMIAISTISLLATLAIILAVAIPTLQSLYTYKPL